MLILVESPLNCSEVGHFIIVIFHHWLPKNSRCLRYWIQWSSVSFHFPSNGAFVWPTSPMDVYYNHYLRSQQPQSWPHHRPKRSPVSSEQTFILFSTTTTATPQSPLPPSASTEWPPQTSWSSPVFPYQSFRSPTTLWVAIVVVASTTNFPHAIPWVRPVKKILHHTPCYTPQPPFHGFSPQLFLSLLVSTVGLLSPFITLNPHPPINPKIPSLYYYTNITSFVWNSKPPSLPTILNPSHNNPNSIVNPRHVAFILDQLGESLSLVKLKFCYGSKSVLILFFFFCWKSLIFVLWLSRLLYLSKMGPNFTYSTFCLYNLFLTLHLMWVYSQRTLVATNQSKDLCKYHFLIITLAKLLKFIG